MLRGDYNLQVASLTMLSPLSSVPQIPSLRLSSKESSKTFFASADGETEALFFCGRFLEVRPPGGT